MTWFEICDTGSTIKTIIITLASRLTYRCINLQTRMIQLVVVNIFSLGKEMITIPSKIFRICLKGRWGFSLCVHHHRIIIILYVLYFYACISSLELWAPLFLNFLFLQKCVCLMITFALSRIIYVFINIDSTLFLGKSARELIFKYCTLTSFLFFNINRPIMTLKPSWSFTQLSYLKC